MMPSAAARRHARPVGVFHGLEAGLVGRLSAVYNSVGRQTPLCSDVRPRSSSVHLARVSPYWWLGSVDHLHLWNNRGHGRLNNSIP